jgi:DNA gyrase/topoisomerase IV subunit B
LYCLNTSKKIIKIHNIIFTDWDEIYDAEINEILIIGSKLFSELAPERRDRMYQAVLLVGTDFDIGEDLPTALENEAVLRLIAALNVRIESPELGMSADIDGLRYSKVIVITDDGVHGREIRRRVFSFLYTYNRALLTAGRVFVPDRPMAVNLSADEFKKLALLPSRSIRPVPDSWSLAATLASLP